MIILHNNTNSYIRIIILKAARGILVQKITDILNELTSTLNC